MFGLCYFEYAGTLCNPLLRKKMKNCELIFIAIICRQKPLWSTNATNFFPHQLIRHMWWPTSVIVFRSINNIYVLVHGYLCKGILKVLTARPWYEFSSHSLYTHHYISTFVYFDDFNFLTMHQCYDFFYFPIKARVLREFSPEEVTANIYTMVDVLLHHIQIEPQHGHSTQVYTL